MYTTGSTVNETRFLVNPPATPPRASTGRSNVAEFSVSELSTAIKRTLEDGYSYVRLRGEVSGYRGPHSSGHCYFGIKDDKAKIDAVVWRGVFGRLKFKPEEGMEVVAQGRITTFPGSSKYQIVIEALEPAGAGALMALLEERKKKFAADGLFADERKKPLPYLPRVVGVITSPTGAVIRDMLHGFEERFPAHVVVWPVRVQGEASANEVAQAVRGFNALSPGGHIPRPDVLIVARGGGSLEDLWGFNEEEIVRAVAESTIPIISAVGHETDWTLIDLAADARAPTPTKAAEWAVPKYAELQDNTGKCTLRLRVAIRRHLESQRTLLKAAARGLPPRDSLLALPRQRFDACEKRLTRALLANTRTHTLNHARLASRLSPRILQAQVGRAADRLERLSQVKAGALTRSTTARRTRFERLAGRLSARPIRTAVSQYKDRLTMLDERAARALSRTVTTARRGLTGNAQLLTSLSYKSILQRGYAVVRSEAGTTIRSATAVAPGDMLSIEMSDGTIVAQTTGGGVSGPSGSKNDPSQRAPAKPARRAKPATAKDQGSLF